MPSLLPHTASVTSPVTTNLCQAYVKAGDPEGALSWVKVMKDDLRCSFNVLWQRGSVDGCWVLWLWWKMESCRQVFWFCSNGSLTSVAQGLFPSDYIMDQYLCGFKGRPLKRMQDGNSH